MDTLIENQKKKTRVALLSIASNSILVVFKAVVGLLIGSVAIISEAIHSGMDLIAALIAFIAVRISYKSPDADHAFGHGKVENISALAEALLIFAAAGWIIYEAVQKLISPHPIEQISWGLLVMLFSTIANFLVSQRLFRVARETDSAALLADGWHLRTDVYTSLGVFTALGVIFIVGYFAPGYNIFWIDPSAAIIVAMLILKAAFNLTTKSVKELMDISTPTEEQEWMKGYLKNMYPEIISYHRLRTRKSGALRHINFHLAVNPDMTVAEAHELGDRIIGDFKQHFNGADVLLHVEPCDGSCTPACISGCLLTPEKRQAVKKNKP
jgi:cation diffusion facilitator family transporter